MSFASVSTCSMQTLHGLCLNRTPGNSQVPPPKEASEMKWLVKPAEI